MGHVAPRKHTGLFKQAQQKIQGCGTEPRRHQYRNYRKGKIHKQGFLKAWGWGWGKISHENSEGREGASSSLSPDLFSPQHHCSHFTEKKTEDQRVKEVSNLPKAFHVETSLQPKSSVSVQLRFHSSGLPPTEQTLGSLVHLFSHENCNYILWSE